MIKNATFAGVNAASLTAFNADFSINYEKTIKHSKWLLENGCNGLAILGTTGETNSLSFDEREKLLEDTVSSGISAKVLLPGTSTPNIPDTIRLTRHAEKVGCQGALLLPPFYYKNPTEEGLFSYFSEVINGVGGDIKIYLYNFPQQSAISFTIPLVERLLKAFPNKVKGVKDSTGDFNNTKAYIDNFSKDGFEVYSGADAGFQEVLHAGGAGCITATSNIACPLAAKIYANYDNEIGTQAQAQLAKIRTVVAMAQTIPAVKTLKAHISNDISWENIRPPLFKVLEPAKAQLLAAFDALNIKL